MAAPTGTKTEFSTKTILVIDDEIRLAESLAALLRGAGYQVAAATSGPGGMEQIQKKNFDLVITDLRMDDVDGFAIMRYLAEKCPDTQIIVITGHASTESAIEALHQRVADYIPKPFDFEMIRRSIENVFTQQDVDRFKRDLMHMLSHDIKVPLTSVLGFAQLLVNDDGTMNENAAQYAQIISSNSQKALALLDNYLTNARMEAGRLETLLVPVKPTEIIHDEIRLASLEFEKKSIQLETEFGELPTGFRADEPLLTRAISNLVSNAAKYTPRGGRVSIRVQTVEDHVHISISNTGAELSAEDIENMFDRYRRTSSSKGVEGTGLGLHVVKCVAKAHNGDIHCESRGGEISLTLVLPLNTE